MTLPKPFKSSLPPLYSSKHLGKMSSFAGNMLNATTDEEAYLCAMTIASGTVPPMVMKALIELDVLEIIKKDAGHMSPAEIAAQLPTTNPAAVSMLDRMLRLLASYGVFTFRLRTLPDGHVERTYGLAPISKLFANNDDGVSVAPLLLMNQDKVFMESWYHLKDAVLESGVPFNKAHGMTAFEYNGIDPRFNKIFNNAMSSHSTITVKKILEKYKGFEGVSTLVDVAGGIGTTLHTILSKYPSIKAISFDLPHVIKDVPSYPGAEYIEGDMFVSIPKGDAIFLKWICHDWSDDHCLKLLKNCYSALPNHGKVIICDCILPVASESNNASQMIFHMDVVMLAQSIGGKERTEEEFEYLAKSSGFQSYRVACSANEAKIIEFFKNTN